MPTPERAKHPSVFTRALLVSLVLHALLVAWLIRAEVGRPPPPPVRAPMRISLRPLPPRAPSPERPARPGTAAGTPHPSPPATASRPTTAEPPAPATHPQEEPGKHPPAADAPIELFPGGAVARGAGPVPPGDSGASTRKDAPDSREVEGKRVLQRVESWRRDNLAERLVATGVDDYFKDYRRALASHMGPPPPGGGPKHGDLSPGQRWINAWLAALEEANEAHDPPPKGERIPNREMQGDVTGRMDEFVSNQLGPMATQPSFTAQRLLRRAGVIGVPVAVLRIVQRADGSIESTELVASSGDKAFDAYVIEHAPLALAAVPAPPARQGAGLHPDGTRTEWAFYRAEGGCGVMLLRVY